MFTSELNASGLRRSSQARNEKLDVKYDGSFFKLVTEEILNRIRNGVQITIGVIDNRRVEKRVPTLSAPKGPLYHMTVATRTRQSARANWP